MVIGKREYWIPVTNSATLYLFGKFIANPVFMEVKYLADPSVYFKFDLIQKYYDKINV